MTLTLRNVEIEGRPDLDVRIADGRITAIGPKLGPSADEIDGRGGALIPGLCDHHIHLLSLAAQAASVDLQGAAGPDEVARRISDATAARPPGEWLRVVGYHESLAGELLRQDLDALAPRHRLRVQHRSGALWMLNSLALQSLPDADDPPGLDRETGWLWRSDPWLRARLGGEAPPLAPVGRSLAAFGVTAVTDTSVSNDPETASRLAAARRAGDLPQRLTLMSGGPLESPADDAYAVGPVKILLDDYDLPDLDAFTVRIGGARRQGRKLAIHCVTAGELALTLAAFREAGAVIGDRIEHGGVIDPAAIAELAALGLAVVTQPVFIRDRGDSYARDVPPAEHADLYRCGSLLAAGVPVAGSSDAPYGAPDPWAGMATAVRRATAGGQVLGSAEALPAGRALSLYLDEPAWPGRRARRVAPGAVADLCLLKAPLTDALATPVAELVAATLIDGRPAYVAG